MSFGLHELADTSKDEYQEHDVTIGTPPTPGCQFQVTLQKGEDFTAMTAYDAEGDGKDYPVISVQLAIINGRAMLHVFNYPPALQDIDDPPTIFEHDFTDPLVDL